MQVLVVDPNDAADRGELEMVVAKGESFTQICTHLKT